MPRRPIRPTATGRVGVRFADRTAITITGRVDARVERELADAMSSAIATGRDLLIETVDLDHLEDALPVLERWIEAVTDLGLHVTVRFGGTSRG